MSLDNVFRYRLFPERIVSCAQEGYTGNINSGYHRQSIKTTKYQLLFPHCFIKKNEWFLTLVLKKLVMRVSRLYPDTVPGFVGFCKIFTCVCPLAGESVLIRG